MKPTAVSRASKKFNSTAAKKILKEMSDDSPTSPGPMKLPSRFQINDVVSIRFTSLFVPSAKVNKVLFSKGKVLYDLEVYLGAGAYTRIHNIDSAIVEDYVFPEYNDDKEGGVWEQLSKGPRLDPNKKH